MSREKTPPVGTTKKSLLTKSILPRYLPQGKALGSFEERGRRILKRAGIVATRARRLPRLAREDFFINILTSDKEGFRLI